ncbi:AMP-binding protein, partial [Endozoicomonas sp.]|uniref:AMP-binding protein n=1 Tax=Endozoicomonas sp. TaxID=1892382 RepID=UPI00383AA78F
MKTALTPMDFARRTRSLYADREAVVDGDLRMSYTRFFDRCDRWSNALQKLGIKPGDRVVYIAPNTHSQLESFYSIPQIGAIIVPVNYRLSADDFIYIINHCGAKMVCVASDYLEVVENAREAMPDVEHFVALENVNTIQSPQQAWLDYNEALKNARPTFTPPDIDENDLISINYTSGTTGRPKGVMISHRNAYMNIVGTLLHFDITASDRYLWTVPMFHANGWTFVWTITARGGTHLCLPQAKPEAIFHAIKQEQVTLFCAAPTVLISMANAPQNLRRDIPRGLRVITAGSPPAAITIERIEEELGWELTQVYGMTETSPFITVCEQRPEHDQLSANDRATIK